VVRLLTPKLCLRAVEHAFRALARDEVVQPLRTLITLPDGEQALLSMPAYLERPPVLGAKLLTLFSGNPARGLPQHQGVVLLFDAGTGALRAVVDAESVTALRTAAASALATRLLAREGADDLAILGSGVQAASHLDAVLGVRPIRRVRVWSRTRAHAETFVARARARLAAQGRPGAEAEEGPGGGERAEAREDPGNVDLLVAPDPRSAVDGASVICTVTASPEPVLSGRWIAPGAHVNAVGAYTPTTRELDSEAVRRARVFVDRRESALAEAGDVLIPIKEGVVGEGHILGELGDLLEGRLPGRTAPGDRTVFKSLGLAVQDLAAASALVDRVLQEESGKRGDGPR
jgi:alanine dehydrogenase